MSSVARISADRTSPAERRADERLTWAAAGLGLDALGLESAELLFAPAPALSSRYEVMEESEPFTRARFPLPGTSDARGNLGNLSGRPGPLGTGWVWLTAFRGGLGALVRARCTQPRSASLAEREWNLLCHLRAHGVGTCAPLLVGARGAGFFASRSFVLVRAPEDSLPLPRWLRTDGIGAERARGLESVGRTLALLRRSRVEVPELRAEHLWLTPSGSGECEAHAGDGPSKNKLPGVTLVRVQGGRMRGRGRARGGTFARLFAELRGLCTSDECARVARLCEQ